jgi:Zn-dependent M28 family amino/carboxypeptidase
VKQFTTRSREASQIRRFRGDDFEKSHGAGRAWESSGKFSVETDVVLRPFTCLLAASSVPAVLLAMPLAAQTDSSALRDAVTVEAIRAHQQALQEIADADGGARVSGSPGYDASVRYVEQKLRDAGYQVAVQSFQFPFYQEPSPSEVARLDPEPTTYVHGTDFLTLRYSGSGTVEGVVVPTSDVVIPPPAQPGSTSGCEPVDFPAAPAGPAVALVQRGTCTFAAKVANAAAAGYEAVIIFNEGQAGRQEVLSGTLGAPVGIPIVGASFALGEELHGLTQRGEVRVRIRTDTIAENRETANVIGETEGGAADRVVVVGAHLDSVPEGPGINDNGSGTATVLELAIQMSQLGIAPANRLRFAFWGAEEWGLLGSTHYVDQLPEVERKKILLNLNFDMLGSPNPVRFVYDGDGSEGGPAGPAGSAEIEDIFLDYFRGQNLATLPTAFDGRSDYGPFIAQGIAAGGLFSGAEGLKTPEQAQVFGGTAGEAYDRCYHQACDDLANNDDRSLDELSDAAAHATLHFAFIPPAPVVAALVAGVERAAAGVPLETLPFRGEAQLQK